MSMRMKTTLLSLLACFCLVLGVAPTVAQTPKAKRINRAIDSLSQTTACAIWRADEPLLVPSIIFDGPVGAHTPNRRWFRTARLVIASGR